MPYPLSAIFGQFELEESFVKAEPIVAGHINDTFLITVNGENQQKYILQRINHKIFNNIPELQQNILRVISHIGTKLKFDNGSYSVRNVVSLIPAKDGKWYVKDESFNFWRVMSYISGSYSYHQLSSKDLAYSAGLAFGEFNAMLSDLPGEPLFETIRDFHNLEFRLQQFREAIQNNNAHRIDLVLTEISEIEKRSEEMTLINRLGREGKLPKRIVHCDTKINNVLFDEHKNILCVIDLDTAMTGYITSDFGDAIRTGANTGKEDDTDLNLVSLSIELFEGYTRGFLTGTASFITRNEIDCLAFSAKMFAYMQSVRFLTDFINGDTYYKVSNPMHNLHRTRAQLKLLHSMEEQFGTMSVIVKEVAKEKCRYF